MWDLESGLYTVFTLLVTVSTCLNKRSSAREKGIEYAAKKWEITVPNSITALELFLDEIVTDERTYFFNAFWDLPKILEMAPSLLIEAVNGVPWSERSDIWDSTLPTLKGIFFGKSDHVPGQDWLPLLGITLPLSLSQTKFDNVPIWLKLQWVLALMTKSLINSSMSPAVASWSKELWWHLLLSSHNALIFLGGEYQSFASYLATLYKLGMC